MCTLIFGDKKTHEKKKGFLEGTKQKNQRKKSEKT